MAELHISKPGVSIKINTEKSIEDIQKELPCGISGTVFEGVDKNEGKKGFVDDGAEMDVFVKNLKAAGYEVTVVEDKKAPKADKTAVDTENGSRAYNSTIQNMRGRYNQEELTSQFKTDDADKVSLSDANVTTLWALAKKALMDEGLVEEGKTKPSNRAINDRIAQIAAVNGLNNVNNVPAGKKLIIHLKDTAVQTVKNTEGQNSAAALGGAAPARASVKPEKAENKAGDKQVEKGEKVKENQKEVSLVGPSSIKIEKTLIDQGYKKNDNDVTNDTKEGFEPALADGDKIYQYTKGEGAEPEEEAFKLEYADGTSITAATVDDLKTKHKEYTEAKVAIKDLKDVPEVPENGTDEEKAAAETNKTNAEAENAKISKANADEIRKMIEKSGGNLKVIQNIIDNYFNKLSAEDKSALVQDLLKTKDAQVVRSLLYKQGKNDAAGCRDTETNEFLDKETAKTVVALYQEIRAKENAEEILTYEEIALKNILTSRNNTDLYKIEADTENGIVEKNLRYNIEGEAFYIYKDSDGKEWKASTPEALDGFVAKINAYKAETDATKKANLKTEILGTTDPQIARSILANRDTFGLVSTNIAEFIKSWDMYVLQDLAIPNPIDEGENRAVAEAVVARINELYTSEERTQGKIENALYLDKAFEWIEKVAQNVEVTDSAGNKTTVKQIEVKGIDGNPVKVNVSEYKAAIISTYFTIENVSVLDADGNPTKDADGNNVTTNVYNFAPHRRPTSEEMEALMSKIDELDADDKKAFITGIINNMEVEYDNYGQYTEKIENKYLEDSDFTAILADRYEKHIDSLESAEDLLKTTEKLKVLFYHKYNQYCEFPLDKIMEKIETFDTSDEEVAKTVREIRIKLLEVITNAGDQEKCSNRNWMYEATGSGTKGRCSDANRLKLVQSFIKEDENGAKVLDRDDAGNPSIMYLAQALPGSCKDGEAAEAFKTVFMNDATSHEDIRGMVYLMNHSDDAVLDQDMINKVYNTVVNATDDYWDYGDETNDYRELLASKKFKPQVWDKLNEEQKAKIVEHGGNNCEANIVLFETLGAKVPDRLIYVGDKNSKTGNATRIVTRILENNPKLKDDAKKIAAYMEKYDKNFEHGELVYPWTQEYMTNRAIGSWLGETLFHNVKGLGSGKADTILGGEGKYEGLITKDTVPHLVEQFNRHKNDKYGIFNATTSLRIMSFLVDDNIDNDKKDVIVNAMIEYAKDHRQNELAQNLESLLSQKKYTDMDNVFDEILQNTRVIPKPEKK